MAKEQRRPIQLTKDQFNAIKGKYGLDNITREQFNTSLRDRHRAIRLSDKLVKNIDDSGMTLNDYRRIIRATKEAALVERGAEIFKEAAFGDKTAIKHAKFFIGGFRKSLERMMTYDTEYVYIYKGAGTNTFRFNIDEGEVTITSSETGSEKTYNIDEWPGLRTVLGMSKTVKARKAFEEVSDVLFADMSEEDERDEEE